MVNNKKILVIVLSFIFTSISFSQVKFWVKFKNKTGTPYTTVNPSAYLSTKAINRRTTYNIAIDQLDLPVNPSYVSLVDAISNVTILYVSKWLNACVISIPNTTPLTAINALPFVQSSTQANRYKIDLIKANKQVLFECDIEPKNIWTMNRCTFENDFFSYRQDKGKTGRMWALITL